MLRCFALILVLAAGSTPADAFIFHGGGANAGGGGGGQLTSLTVENDTGSSQAANFITPQFGMGYKKADLPAGQYPVFKLTDGTVLSCSVGSHHTSWADGSAKMWGGNFCLVPTSVTGSGGTVTVNVFSGGSAPSASSRTLSDFAAASTDLNFSVVGQDNLSGTWVSDLNQGIAAHGADYVWSDGPAGKCWRVRAAFQQSSADHGQLEGWWYVCAGQTSGGALAGLRYLPAITQPYYNVASPAPDYRSFSSVQVLNGASLIADLWSSHGAGRAFTCTNGSQNLASAGHGLELPWLVKLSTTGSMCPGLSTSTTYFAAPIDANTFSLGTDSSQVASFAGFVTATGTGSGTQTATPYPYLTQFETLYAANADGTWRFAQGGGSFTSDSVVRVSQSRTYLRSAGLIPPYSFENLTGVVDNTTCDWYLMASCNITHNLGETGERNEIGPETNQAVVYWWNNTATDERVLRNIGLAGGELPMNIRDASTLSIPVVNNTTYSGMPAHNSSFTWSGNCAAISGFTAPAHTNVCNSFDVMNGSHMPDWSYVAFLVTGEPQFHDQIAEAANMEVYSRFAGTDTATAALSGPTSIGGNGAVRNGSINGTNYYGWCWNSGNLQRTDGWCKRDKGAAVAAVTDAENASYPTYFADLDHVDYDAAAAYISMLAACCTYVTTNGLWGENGGEGGIVSSWANHYQFNAVAMDYARGEYSGALTFGNYLAKWEKHMHDSFGVIWMGYYQMIDRQAPNNQNSAYATSDNGIGFGEGPSISWNSVTNKFTMTDNVIPGYTPVAGDRYIFDEQLDTPPGGFSGEIPYWVVNVTGSGVGATFQLSASLGGSAVTITNTGSDSFGMSRIYSPTFNAHMVGSVNDIGYLDNTLGALDNMASAGGTVDATTIGDVAAFVQAQSNYPAYYQTTPKYFMQPTR